jgi:hypothetical protein
MTNVEYQELMNDIILKGSFEIRYNTIPNKKEKAKQIAIDQTAQTPRGETRCFGREATFRVSLILIQCEKQVPGQ